MTQREDFRGERRSKDPQEIESDIAETRAAISERIDAISDRLSPENIKEEAKQGAKQMANEVKEAAVSKVMEMKDSAVETVTHAAETMGQAAQRAGNATFSFARDNSIPLALIGVGLGWLIVSSARRRSREDMYEPLEGYEIEESEASIPSYEYRPRYGLEGEEYEPRIAGEYEPSLSAEYEAGRAAYAEEPGRVRRAVGAAKERVEASMDAARERAGDMAHRAGDAAQRARRRIGAKMERAGTRARAMSGRTKTQLRRVGNNVVDFSSDQPLVIGAAALMAGFGVGLLLPKTQRENEWMGPARDRLVGEARETVQEVGRAVKETARDLTQTLKETERH